MPGTARVIRRALFGFLFAVVAGCSGETSPGELPTDVAVTLSEFEFASSSATFKAGVPYRFHLRNAGAGEHEWAVVPGGAMDESGALIEVEEDWLLPGATISRTVIFPGPGRYDFVCFLPGHLEAGMRLPVNVVAR